MRNTYRILDLEHMARVYRIDAGTYTGERRTMLLALAEMATESAARARTNAMAQWSANSVVP